MKNTYSNVYLDLTVDVSKIETQQAHELNSCAHAYGMFTNDFFSFLNNDLEEAENMRIAKEQEEEKAMFSVSISCLRWIWKDNHCFCSVQPPIRRTPYN